jgi:transcription elongation factor Elf1
MREDDGNVDYKCHDMLTVSICRNVDYKYHDMLTVSICRNVDYKCHDMLTVSVDLVNAYSSFFDSINELSKLFYSNQDQCN